MNAASVIRSKGVAVLSAGVLGMGLLGGVAFAMTPASSDGATSMAPDSRVASAAQDQRAGKLKTVLDALVAKGVITQAQEDAIIDALTAERGDHPKIREFVGDVFKASVDYLGLPADQVKKDLQSGKSLGEIANATPGKSRDGLLKFLDDAAGKRIDAAVDAGKITRDQAEKLRTKVDEAIVRIVDHSGDGNRAPKPAQTPKPTT
jgi:polyhydroxyalkanoate synthesis regulator phasin